MNFNRFQKNKGFTLIEMLVSIALFSIVLTIVIGSIFTIVDSNKKARSLSTVMNNLNFAVESMTRDIKTADPGSSLYKITEGVLSLRDDQNINVVYEKRGDLLMKSKNSSETNLLPEEVVVGQFDVDVIRSSSGQPRVFIYLKGYVELSEKTKSDFVIQTTVSPRKLNI